MRNELTQEELKERLDYDPDTGVFTWKVQPTARIPAGAKAGCLNNHGYMRIAVYGRRTTAHRLAWLYIYGRWPNGDIDHINGIRTDNRACNLREVGRRENLQNKKIHREGKLSGCTYRSHAGKWEANIRILEHSVYLGRYQTESEANRVYLEALDHLDDVTWFYQFKRQIPKGYYRHKSSGKWIARIPKNGRRVHLGSFDTAQEAHDAYLRASEALESEAK